MLSNKKIFLLSIIVSWFLQSCDRFKPSEVSNLIYSGTAIFCIADKDYIIIAGDTKQSDETYVNGKKFDGGMICKVYQKGNMIYAGSGLTGSTGTNVDIKKSILKLKIKSTTLASKMKEICAHIQSELIKVLQLNQRESPRKFQTEILNKVQSFYSFGMFENGKSKLGNLMLRCRVNAKNQIYLEADSLIETAMPKWKWFGHTNYIDSVIKVNPKYPYSFGTPYDFLNSIIKGQSKRSPEDVNDKVDIIRLERKGAKWIQRNQVCN